MPVNLCLCLGKNLENSERRKMACVVESSFDSALEKAVRCLSDLEMSRELRVEQTDAISTLVSGKDLLAVLPTGFGKSLIFQMVVRIKQIMTGKLSSAIVVCPLQLLVHFLLQDHSGIWRHTYPQTILEQTNQVVVFNATVKHYCRNSVMHCRRFGVSNASNCCCR